MKNILLVIIQLKYYKHNNFVMGFGCTFCYFDK